jgi:ligand-binding sensor domain-containing protein
MIFGGANAVKRANPAGKLSVPIIIACLLAAAPLMALDPERQISQYGHAAWRMSDGFFSGSPFTMAQTRDGYLWVGTHSGLVRFDGVRFAPWRPEHDERLPSSDVLDLRAGSDGSLWIATLGGLSRWKNERLTNYPSGPGGIVSVLEDPKRRIWFGQNIAAEGTGPLCEVMGDGGTRCYGPADGVPRLRRAHPLLEDRGGNLWLASDETLCDCGAKRTSVSSEANHRFPPRSSSRGCARLRRGTPSAGP